VPWILALTLSAWYQRWYQTERRPTETLGPALGLARFCPDSNPTIATAFRSGCAARV
jgi:hypothetical protein